MLLPDRRAKQRLALRAGVFAAGLSRDVPAAAVRPVQAKASVQIALAVHDRARGPLVGHLKIERVEMVPFNSFLQLKEK